MTDIPVIVPVVAALVIVGLQYLLAPWFLQLLVPAHVLDPRDGGYATDQPIGRIVADACRVADVPLVRLGIVDDGTPNAFTFGRTRRDARIWVTRGLLERLDEEELEAVVAHEVAHIRNYDFAVMTAASVVPMVLYYAYLGTRTNGRPEALAAALVAWVGYLVAQLAVLALGRAREVGADHASCARTGNGDALCSALVKVVYGIGEEREARAARVKELVEHEQKRIARKLEARGRRMRVAGTLGIAQDRGAGALAGAVETSLSQAEVMQALRWDACNPWSVAEEKLSTHPTVVSRIAALERSGLPGAPKAWRAADVTASCSGPELSRARRRFAGEALLRLGGWFALVAAVVVLRLAGTDADRLAACLLLVAGVILALRAVVMAPLGAPERVSGVRALLDRLDASPVSGILVRVRGSVVGRVDSGAVFSPDLTLRDGSGLVPLLWVQPLPFARTLFGLLQADEFVGRDVEAVGWYHRGAAGPWIELRELRARDAGRTRCWMWAGRVVLSLAVLLAGAVAVVLTV
ncbi:M48 family metalloprotease [Motilibacter sp. K478]|nr:M48 family metalloprotease [Motilibacter aurantiacus]